MIKLQQVGVGINTHTDHEVYDSTGTGLLPLQTDVSGTATYRVMGRVAPEAPWVQIIAPQTVGILQSINWMPWLQLEVTAGTGTATLWLGEK